MAHDARIISGSLFPLTYDNTYIIIIDKEALGSKRQWTHPIIYTPKEIHFPRWMSGPLTRNMEYSYRITG